MNLIFLSTELQTISLLDIPCFSKKKLILHLQKILGCHSICKLATIDSFHEVYVDEHCILKHNLKTWDYKSKYFHLESLPGPCIITGKKLSNTFISIDELSRMIYWNGMENIGINTEEYYE